MLDALADAFKAAVDTITPINLSGTVQIFKDLGRSQQAKKLLDHYMAHRTGDRGFFDLKSHPFGNEVRDSDVRDAFDTKLQSFRAQVDPREILLRIAAHSGWNPEDITALASLPVDAYRKLFEEADGEDITSLVKAALQFRRIANASEEMRQVSAVASEALTLIGKTSAINARRVSMWGITVNPPNPGDA